MTTTVTGRVRLVAVDVDGTLIDHDGRLPDDRRDAVRALTAAGVPLVMATGKLWSSIRGLWELLALPGPHVTCNGAAVVGADGTRHHLDPLAEDVAEEVLAVLRAQQVPHAVYLADGAVVTDRVRPEHDVLPLLGEPLPTTDPRDRRPVLKVLSILAPEEEGDLRGLAAERARVQRTSHRFLEWNAASADKASGLRHVVAALGIGMEDVVAIGDAENDVPMLRAAGTGVAVSAASEAAIGAADLHLAGDLSAFLLGLADAAVRA